jgi:hypothetical protein
VALVQRGIYTPNEDRRPSSAGLAASPPGAMFRSRTLAALLSASIAVQLVLAGGGTTCVREGEAAASTAASAMAGMDMPAADQARDADPSAAPTDRDHPARGDTPCGRTTSPAVCQILSACAAGFVSVETPDNAGERELAAGAPASDTTPPASRSIAPELPPPRA